MCFHFDHIVNTVTTNELLTCAHTEMGEKSKTELLKLVDHLFIYLFSTHLITWPNWSLNVSDILITLLLCYFLYKKKQQKNVCGRSIFASLSTSLTSSACVFWQLVAVQTKMRFFHPPQYELLQRCSNSLWALGHCVNTVIKVKVQRGALMLKTLEMIQHTLLFMKADLLLCMSRVKQIICTARERKADWAIHTVLDNWLY